MKLETVLCEIEGPLAMIRLNRPEVLNALNRALVRDLRTALEEVDLRGAERQRGSRSRTSELSGSISTRGGRGSSSRSWSAHAPLRTSKR